jgi:hypothetical protein
VRWDRAEHRLLVLATDAAGATSIDEIQVPSQLERDCRVSRKIQQVCLAIDSLDGASAARALATLHTIGGEIEQTVALASRTSIAKARQFPAVTLTGPRQKRRRL